MDRFDFLRQHRVDINEVNRIGNREFFIDNFIAERSINVLFGAAGKGKTWLAFALANYFSGKKIHTIYLDTDNGIQTLKDRNYDTMLEANKEYISYINSETMDNPRDGMNEVIGKLKTNANNDFYTKTVLIMDSFKFFLNGGIYDETKIYNFFVMCKIIRRCGGTVIVLNHTHKNSDAMKGGGTVTDSSDEVWAFKNVYEDDESMHVIVTPEKNRIGTKEAGYTINTKTLELTSLDTVVASMGEEERAFVEKVRDLLKDGEITQGEILGKLEVSRANKNALEWLEKHIGRYWESHKEWKKRVYTRIIEK